MVVPPSGLRRMKEFSPVIRTALGSTGGGIGRLPFEFVCAARRGTVFRHPRCRMKIRSDPARSKGPKATAISARYPYLARMSVAHDHAKTFSARHDNKNSPGPK